MPTFGAWRTSDLIVAGPDPFGSATLANADAAGATSFTISAAAPLLKATLSDDDATLEEGDGTQILTSAIGTNGVDYSAGVSGVVAPEYSYTIRPAGSTDPADNITLYVLSFDGVVQGVAASSRLIAGQSYQIVGIESETPVVAYSAMAVCFAAGTLVATRRGPKPVEALTEGDRLQTCDNGYAPVRWLGRWRVSGMGAHAPVRFAPGVLGNDRALELSGQHRVLIRPMAGPLAGEEVLVAAKTLVGLPGISRAPRLRVEWVHVLLPTHEVIFAENMRSETLLTGPQVTHLVEPAQGRILRDILAADPFSGLPARPIVPPAKAARLILPALQKTGALCAIA